jgi:hypothetical protein
MKRRNGLIALTIVGLMAVLLCLPVPAIGGGNPPNVGEGLKVVGPNLHAELIMGWRESTGTGLIDVFVRVNDKLYMFQEEGSAAGFISLFDPDPTATDPAFDHFDIPYFVQNNSGLLPDDIKDDFNPSAVAAVVANEADVTNYEFQCLGVVNDSACDCSGDSLCPLVVLGVPQPEVVCYCPLGPPPGNMVQDYKYFVHSNIKISFAEPANK